MSSDQTSLVVVILFFGAFLWAWLGFVRFYRRYLRGSPQYRMKTAGTPSDYYAARWNLVFRRSVDPAVERDRRLVLLRLAVAIGSFIMLEALSWAHGFGF
jgi:hypothetical protein